MADTAYKAITSSHTEKCRTSIASIAQTIGL